MSAEQEIETQRRDAVKAAMVMKRAFTAERTGLKKKLKSVKDREKAMFDALARNGVSKAAFEEAERRAWQDQKDLDIFDSEASEVETWMRDWIEDDQTNTAEPAESAAEPTPEEQHDIAETNMDTQADTDTIATSDDGDPDGVPAAAIQFEDDPAAATPEPGADKEVEWDMGDAPAADPNAAQKTAQVAPAAGAAGVSMDDIPMPSSQIHDLQKEQAKRKFVDRRERMSAADFNEQAKAGTGQG